MSRPTCLALLVGSLLTGCASLPEAGPDTDAIVNGGTAQGYQ
jgi:hypothetical protein